jgi:DNA-binding NarL/FixJ family response regulator
MLSIVLVTDDAELTKRVERILLDGPIHFAGHLAPTDLETTLDAEVLLVAGPLEPRTEALVPRVRSQFRETPIVACAPRSDPRSVRWAVNHGADGVVWLADLERSMPPTVLAVDAGQLVVPRENRADIQPPDLTTREKQVLSLIVMGLSNGEIAQKLYLTESTVKSHLSGAFRKLGVGSRAEAARLVSDPERGFGTGILAITRPSVGNRPPREG